MRLLDLIWTVNRFPLLVRWSRQGAIQWPPTVKRVSLAVGTALKSNPMVKAASGRFEGDMIPCMEARRPILVYMRLRTLHYPFFPISTASSFTFFNLLFSFIFIGILNTLDDDRPYSTQQPFLRYIGNLLIMHLTGCMVACLAFVGPAFAAEGVIAPGGSTAVRDFRVISFQQVPSVGSQDMP